MPSKARPKKLGKKINRALKWSILGPQNLGLGGARAPRAPPGSAPAGDINIHVKDQNDLDAEQFEDLLMVHGFKQHVNFPTQQQGNILDLVMTQETAEIEIKEINSGPFLSDHCLVVAKLNIQKEGAKVTKTQFRNWAKVDKETILNDMSLCDTAGETLQEYYHNYKNKISLTLNEKLPLRTMNTSNKTKKLWYNSELSEHRRLVRNRERIYRKYKQNHQWTAFKSEQKKYRKRLRAIKSNFINMEIKAHRGEHMTFSQN